MTEKKDEKEKATVKRVSPAFAALARFAFWEATRLPKPLNNSSRKHSRGGGKALGGKQCG
jgi:hypothetical protein